MPGSDWTGGPPPPPGSLPPPPPPSGWVSPPTPDSVAAFRLAGVGSRLGALVIDWLLLGLVQIPFTLRQLRSLFDGLGTCVDSQGTEYPCYEGSASSGWTLVGSMVGLGLGVAYFGWWQGRTGQTIGKRIIGIEVVREHTGELIGAKRGIGRFAASYLSASFCLAGHFWALWEPRNRTWHDLIADTVVVRAG